MPSDAELDLVAAIFGEFAMHYGSVRMAAHWNGQDAEAVQRYWARRIRDLSPRSIRYAMANKPDNPPTVDEFRRICYRSPPEPEPLKIERKRTPEEIQQGFSRLEAIKRRFGYGKANDGGD